MLLDAPGDYYELEKEFCSNFDHEIDYDVADKLKTLPAFAVYPAYQWYGKVWFDKVHDIYCCRVTRHGTYVGTVYASTADDLKTKCCSIYGND
jgi:hypothetical protein